jgi:hypothetical protein
MCFKGNGGYNTRMHIYFRRPILIINTLRDFCLVNYIAISLFLQDWLKDGYGFLETIQAFLLFFALSLTLMIILVCILTWCSERENYTFCPDLGDENSRCKFIIGFIFLFFWVVGLDLIFVIIYSHFKDRINKKSNDVLIQSNNLNSINNSPPPPLMQI